MYWHLLPRSLNMMIIWHFAKNVGGSKCDYLSERFSMKEFFLGAAALRLQDSFQYFWLWFHDPLPGLSFHQSPEMFSNKFNASAPQILSIAELESHIHDVKYIVLRNCLLQRLLAEDHKVLEVVLVRNQNQAEKKQYWMKNRETQS